MAAAAPAPAPNSVAVLYFDNLSHDTADAYLADGLSDEIRTRLGQVDRLTVTARTTMQRYRGSAVGDPADLARTLRVAHLVNGTVRRGPGRLRVGVELVRARDGVQLWSETYDRTDNDLLAIETDVAGAVATAIAGRLLPAERATITARATRNPAAYERVLRGNYLLVRRTEQDARRAVAEYQAAIALDSGYAEAFARLAWAYSLFRNWAWSIPGTPSDSLVPVSLETARHALRLDTLSAWAWFAEAAALAEGGNRELGDAERSLQRALQLDSRLAEAWWLRATSRLRAGDTPGFMEAAQRALALEPERPITLTWMGMAMLRERRLDESRRWLDSAVAIAPTFWYALSMRAGLRAWRGDAGGLTDGADALRASRGGGDTALAHVLNAFALASVGDSASARSTVNAIVAVAFATDAPLFDEASVWLAGAQLKLGEREGALRTLERGTATTYLRIYLGYPFLDPLRNEERFRRVVASVSPGGP